MIAISPGVPESGRKRSSRGAIRRAAVAIWMIAAILSSLDSPAQSGDVGNDCLQRARAIYRGMNALPERGHAYEMSYTVRAIMRPDLKREDVVSHVDLKMSDRAMHFVSHEVEVYQDGRQAFTVLPERHVIYLTDADIEGMREKRIASIASLQDTLFSMCQSAHCSEIRQRGEILSQVTMMMNPRAQARYHIRTITLLIDTKDEMIRRMMVRYTSDSRIETLSVEVEKLNRACAPDELNKPIASNFFSGDAQLLPRYRNYRVIDNRGRRFTK